MGLDLITGGAGFIGSHLVDRLLAEGRSVRVLDSLVVGRRANLDQHRGNPLLAIVEADVADAAAVDAACEGADRVFHLAARADIVPSIEEPEAYFRANVDGTFAVLQAARRHGVRRLVYAASSSAYGVPTVYPTPETAPADPRYPYALTKYLGEQLVHHWAKVYRLPAVSVRFFNVFGPRARTSGTYGAVFGVFLAQLNAGQPLTIVGDGEQTRDFTFVSDAVAALLAAIEHGRIGEAYNVGSGKPSSVNELVRLLGSPPTVHIPKRPGEPDCTFADTGKIAAELGWKPQVSFAEGVRIVAEQREYWRDAPVWTPASIAAATTGWFKMLGQNEAPPEQPAARSSGLPPMPAANARSKVLTLDGMRAVCDRLHDEDKRIVHAHGTFDLLHLGHVRHFEAARRLGDVLVATVTSDRFVNKGPGRPAFPEAFRAEMLAALADVAFVAICDAPGAVPAIEAIRPHVYVKGSEYADPADDVTGKIVVERQAVEAAGGRLAFTDEATFSSSVLINRHASRFPLETQDFLADLRARGTLPRLLSLLETLRGFRIVLIGEALVEQRDYADRAGGAVIARKSDTLPAGVLAAANQAAELCGRVDVVTALDLSSPHLNRVRPRLRANVSLHPVAGEGPAIGRRVLVDSPTGQILFESAGAANGLASSSSLIATIESALELARDAGAALVHDFPTGLAPDSAIMVALAERAHFVALRLSSWRRPSPRAGYFMIDGGISPASRDGAALANLVRRYDTQPDVDHVLVRNTDGKLTISELPDGSIPIPSFNQTEGNRRTDGSLLFAATAPLMAAGATIREAGFVGSVLAALSAGADTVVERAVLIKAIVGLLK